MQWVTVETFAQIRQKAKPLTSESSSVSWSAELWWRCQNCDIFADADADNSDDDNGDVDVAVKASEVSVYDISTAAGCSEETSLQRVIHTSHS